MGTEGKTERRGNGGEDKAKGVEKGEGENWAKEEGRYAGVGHPIKTSG